MVATRPKWHPGLGMAARQTTPAGLAVGYKAQQRGEKRLIGLAVCTESNAARSQSGEREGCWLSPQLAGANAGLAGWLRSGGSAAMAL